MIPDRAWLEGPCPQCEAGWRCPATDSKRPACEACSEPAAPLHPEGVDDDGSLQHCLICGHDELYWARDFPKRLGMTIVIVAAILAPFTYYISLAVGAVLDAALVFIVRKRMHCYRCRSIHHGFPGAEHWEPFNLEVSDVHEYGEKAAVVQTLGTGHELPRARRKDLARD